jgi:cytochrome P450
MITYLIILGIILYVAQYLLKHIRQHIKFKHIPGVSQIGNFGPCYIPLWSPISYYGNYVNLYELSQRFKKFPVFRTVAGTQTTVVLNSVSALKHVYLKNAKNYVKPGEELGMLKLYGENIVTLAGGKSHMLHRNICEPVFHEKQLRNLVDVSNEATDSLIQKLVNKADPLIKVEVNSDMVDVTLDIIGKSNFGHDLQVFTGKKHTDFDRSKHTMSFYDALHTSSTLGILLHAIFPKSLHNVWPLSKVNQSIKEVDLYLEELIKERAKSEDKPLDLLSLLVESNEVGLEKLSTQEIKSDSFIFLIAGHETCM